MKTAVSVIVPCYNVAPYVDECMSGLAEQTLGPMEIICVDDGSTDGTLELLYRWREKDNRLRVISQSNAGVSAARNAGLDAAEGKYVGFVDPDDRVDRRMFSRLLGAAEKNDADVVVCGCREFVEKDGVVVHEGGWSPDDEFYPEERVEQFRRGSAWCRCVGPVYNKLVRRSLVEEHSLRFVVGLKEGEDLAFLLMLLPFAPRLRTLSDRFYHYRRERPGSATYLVEEHSLRFVVGLKEGEDLAFLLMLLPFAPRLRTLSDRFYHYRRERPGSATYGRDLLLGDFRMDLLGMDRVARFWQRHGLLDSPAVFGLVDYYMEFIRRHFIMKEGAFFKASPEDRETLLSGWKKWLELVGGEKALSRLDRWDQAFCRLLLDYPLQGNFFSSLRARLMSSRKGRRGAYYTLKRHLAR